MKEIRNFASNSFLIRHYPETHQNETFHEKIFYLWRYDFVTPARCFWTDTREEAI